MASDWSALIVQARSQPLKSDQALAVYQRALQSLGAPTSPDFRREITLKEMALVLFQHGKLQEAKDCLEKVLTLQKESYAPKPELFNTLWMLHTYEKNLNHQGPAEEYGRAMLAVAGQMNGSDRAINVAESTVDLSELLILSNRPDDANRLLVSALPLPADPKFDSLKGRLQLQQARVFNLKCRYDEAEAVLAVALNSCPKDLAVQVECRQALSETYLFQRQYAKAIATTEEVLALMRHHGRPSTVWCSETRCYLQLSQLFSLDGRAPQAVRDPVAAALVMTDDKGMGLLLHELRDRIEQIRILAGEERQESYITALMALSGAPSRFTRCLRETLGIFYLGNSLDDKFAALAARSNWTDSDILRLKEKARKLKR